MHLTEEVRPQFAIKVFRLHGLDSTPAGLEEIEKL